METTPGLNYSLLMDNTAENGTQRVISVYELYGYFNVIIVATLFSLIAFVGLTGNTMVFIAVGLSRKLHNITNAFIVNLGICDFISCAVLPFHAVAVISEDGWPLADWFCSFIASLSIITQTAGILNLTLISLNRYILITKPRQFYMKVYTHHKVAWMIVFTWLFPFFFLLVPQFFLGGLGYQDMFRICIWDSRHKFALIFQGIGALAFIVSTILIIFSYVSIFLFVRRHMRMMANKEDGCEGSVEIVEEESALNDNTVVQTVKSQRTNKKKTISKKQIDITKNLCVVVVAFFICILPYTIHLPTGIYDMRGTYFALLFMANACINPILYAVKHPHFKIIFSCMFRCKYSDIPMPTMGLKKIMRTANSASAYSSTDGRFA
ncbi:5-hydroxytryptamine receptor 1F-like [Lytechinus variegatus]|uniref:5-hydroxytryptamine receptor 1F-like n=1 Tax=Lytechinus variegatus TaxID=7654 RepID=UPI001BB1F712|nr:5-hydroxytryptamine receptor 1F-like [Lytechinus variegatus]XP_041456758.1 5-hydroxytryptamine receptor 1F-like [Lytechinus variegatus]XP_041456759.1 5-hydroxytryptamine receptor 1F-like [Lytechinus variegatus]